MALRAARLIAISRLTQGRPALLSRPCSCLWKKWNRLASTKEIDEDSPIKYSTSKAAKWKAAYSRGDYPEGEEPPWYQPLSVMASTAAFLVYFCILREESDMDKALDRPLHETVIELELQQHLSQIKQEKAEGLDVSKHVEQLVELAKQGTGANRSLGHK